MTTIGQMQPFDPTNDRISTYLEHVQLFFQANGIAEDKQVPILLSIIRGHTYALLSDLLTPVKPTSKSVEQLTQVLVKHYDAKPVVITERFQFHRRNQAPTETVTEYEAKLRRLATHCGFKYYLSEVICDHIVYGLRNKHIQKRLLAETDLKLAKTMEIAQSMEAADQNVQKLKGNELNLRVSETSLGTHKPCYRCGNEQHGPRACPYREAECRNCKKKGHLARMCQSKSRTVYKTPSQVRANLSRKGGNTGTTRRETNWLTVTEETQAEPEPFPDSTIWNFGSHRDTPITVQLKLDEQEVMEVDTGAALTLISEEAQKKLFPKANLSKATVKLQTYTAEPLHVLDTLEVW